MQRIPFAIPFSLLSLTLWLTTAAPLAAQDRGGGAMAGGQALQQPPPGGGMPPPAGGVIPPGFVPPGAGGGVFPPMVGNVGVGAIALTPPPIGYYAAPRSVDYNLGKFYYYPFYYYPHSYWPTQSCPWPERPGEAYMRPPAYMTYPPFLEPNWRYEWNTPQKYYRGFHFWLDQF
jgi:hypothetical protein